MPDHRRRQKHPSSPPLSPTTSNSASSFAVYSPPSQDKSTRPQAPKSQIPNIPRRLLIPKYSLRCPINSKESPVLTQEARSKSRTSVNRLVGRSRADSAPPEMSVSFASGLSSSATNYTPISKDKEVDTTSAENPVGRIEGCRLEVVAEDIELSGYQVFAVEKWIVDRSRQSALLTVYTGDGRDKITVTAIAPVSDLDSHEAQYEWDKALHKLKKDGARPRDTDKGVIMITSLANFRSDYTVVQIPGGDFLQYRQRVFVNINLQRLGCSGRSALTLQEPSEATKEKFLSMFNLPSAQSQASMGLRGDPNATFRQTVIEMVRLMQCGLSLYGMFPTNYDEQNGLLCDDTLNGMERWVSEIGQPYLGIEPTERVTDPTVLSSLISVILAMRSKLSAIGEQNVPKDPLLHPRRFTRSLAQFITAKLQVQGQHASALPTPFHSRTHTPITAEPDQSNPVACTHAYLNLTLMRIIDTTHDKSRTGDTATRLQRAVRNKFDGLTAATSSAMSPSRSISSGHNAELAPNSGIGAAGNAGQGSGLGLGFAGTEKEALLEPTSDLRTLVSRMDGLKGKEYGASIRYLWTGRLEVLDRKREDGYWEDMEEERTREKEIEKEREGEKSDSEDDGGVFPWSNRVTRKIESWAGRELGRSKAKKASMDLSRPSLKSPPGSISHSKVPSVTISREWDDLASGLSSGQASPISPSHSFYGLTTSNQASLSALGLQQGLRMQSPSPSPGSTSVNAQSLSAPPYRRLASWSDAMSAGGDQVEIDIKKLKRHFDPFISASGFRERSSSDDDQEESASAAFHAKRTKSKKDVFKDGLPGLGVRRFEKAPHLLRLKRSSSSDDIAFVDPHETLPLEYMHVDTELCAQWLIFQRRKVQAEVVQSALHNFIRKSTRTNDDLLAYHEGRIPLLKSITSRSADAIDEVDESLSIAGSLTANTDALMYETNVLDVDALWHMARAPRMRVFAIRDRAFGVKGKGAISKSRIGVRDSSILDGHGRFNRAQKTIDGGTRFVDFLGRTESDVEEEEELPEDVHLERHRSGTGTGDETDEDEGHENDFKGDALPSVASPEDGDGQPGFANWALSMFTKWGTVLGVRATHDHTETRPAQVLSNSADHAMPTSVASSIPEGRTDALASSTEDTNLHDKVNRKRTTVSVTNGHFHRLSTVGEEDEPISAPPTPMPDSTSMPIVAEVESE